MPGSGLLYRAGATDLRLLHFSDLLSAGDDNTLIHEVKFEPVVDLMLTAETVRMPQLEALSRKFGLIGEAPTWAHLFSVSEEFGLPFTYTSGGVHCSRANRPPTWPARDWYHYYPPYTLDQKTPNVSKVCGFSVP